MRVIDVGLLLVWGSYAQETHPERRRHRRRLGKCLCITPSLSRAAGETGTLRANRAGTRAASSFRLRSQGVGGTIVLRAGGVSDCRKSLPKRRRSTSHTTISDTPTVRRPVTTCSYTSVSHRDHSCNLSILRRLGRRRVRCLCQKAGMAGQKGSSGRARRSRARTRRPSSLRACPRTFFPTRRAAVGRR